MGLRSINNALGAAANLPGLAVSLASGGSSVSLASFLDRSMPDGTKWNKVYPYALKVMSFENGQSVRNSVSSLSGIVNATGRVSLDGNDSIFEVVLPIAPSNIAVRIPAASQLTVTPRGIIEEHNGAPLRYITISGTTGVAPFRLDQFGTNAPGSGNLLTQLAGDIFANTIRSAQNLVATATGQQADNLIDADLLKPKPADEKVLNLDKRTEDTFNSGIYGTGYWHFHKLHKFVDKYLDRKKQKKYKHEYLVFEMQKDELYYQCSLVDFSFSKRPGTIEYDYKIELVAWDYYKRQSLLDGTALSGTVNRLTQALNTIQNARKIIARAKDVLRGLEQDVDNILAVGRVAGLLVKDAVGIPTALSDFSENIRKNLQSSIASSFKDMSSSSKILLPASAALAMTSYSTTFEQRSDRSVSGSAKIKSASAGVNDIFDNTNDYLDFFDSLQSDSIPVPSEVQTQMDSELDRVRNLDISYFKTQRDALVKSAAVMSAKLGVGDPTFNRIYGIDTPNSQTQGLKTGQLELLQNLNNMIAALNTLIVSKRNTTRAVQNYVEFYTGLAVSNGIDLTNPAGKFSVPLPSGSTLQSLAAQYLGSASRWPEIAAINQLRAPYIDEEGFLKPVIGPTSGRVITVSNPDLLYIGQPIILENPVDPPVSAKIMKIEPINTVTTLVTLSVDVTGYSGEKNTTLRGYLPGTVNSSMMIFIPSAAPSQILGDGYRISPTIQDQKVSSIISKTDLLLTSSGDLAMSSGGDVRYATGTTNLIQAAMLKFNTPRGFLINYPNYGFGVAPGINTADVDVAIINQALQDSFASDPRYSGVLASKISKVGPALDISVVLGLPETDLVLPINATVRN